MENATLWGTTALALSFFATGLAEADIFTVTSAANGGAGSLREALAEAGSVGDGKDTIFILTDQDITVTEGLTYEGVDDLTIHGRGQALRAIGDFPILTTTASQGLSLEALQFMGPGGYSINAQGDIGASGILVDIPETATGIVNVRLRDVRVTGTAGHGIHISDCTLAEQCGGGEGGAGHGSAAGINVELSNVQIDATAHGRFDADGIRVDERGPGSITFMATGLVVESVGADGVELDEGQGGDVLVDVTRGVFVDNGAYCDPELLIEFMPANAKAEFDEGTMTVEAIPGPITASPDDGCFERDVDLYEDGSVAAYEFGIDVDDGFDIDEDGPGSIIATFADATMTGNFDEGFDFDEAGAGGIDAAFLYVLVAENVDDGIKISEESEGDVTGIVSGSEIIANSGVGIVYEEDDGGDLELVILRTATVGNDGGDLGIEAVQADGGQGFVSVIDSEVADGIEVEGSAIDPD